MPAHLEADQTPESPSLWVQHAQELFASPWHKSVEQDPWDNTIWIRERTLEPQKVGLESVDEYVAIAESQLRLLQEQCGMALPQRGYQIMDQSFSGHQGPVVYQWSENVRGRHQRDGPATWRELCGQLDVIDQFHTYLALVVSSGQRYMLTDFTGQKQLVFGRRTGDKRPTMCFVDVEHLLIPTSEAALQTAYENLERWEQRLMDLACDWLTPAPARHLGDFLIRLWRVG